MICPKCKDKIPDYSRFCPQCGKKITQALTESKKKRGNGQGSVYMRSSGHWEAAKTIYRGGKRKTVTKGGFTTKKEAVAYLSELSPTRKKAPTLSIAEIYKALEPTFAKLSEKRRKTYESAYKRLESLEMCNLVELNLADLQGIIDDIDGGFYSKRYVKDLFSKMYQYAFVDGVVDRDLSPYIVLPQKAETEEKSIFTREEIDTLWKIWGEGDDFSGYILIIIYCCLRTGELWSIKCESIDFVKKTMFGGIKNAKGKYSPIFVIDKIAPVLRHFADLGHKTIYDGTPTAFYREWRAFKAKHGFREEL